MALEEAQKIFAEILSRNLYPVKGLKPFKNPYTPLPKNPPKLPPLRVPQATRSETDPASYILNHTALGSPGVGSGLGLSAAALSEDEEPGVVTKIFDTLSIPLELGFNAINESVNVVQGEESIGEAIADQGQEILSAGARIGDNALWKPDIPFTDLDSKFYNYQDQVADKADRTRGSDLLENVGVKNKYGLALGGLALDIAADPLNAVPGLGFVRAGTKGLKGINAATKLAEKAAGPGLKGAEAFNRSVRPAQTISRGGTLGEDVLGSGSRNVGQTGIKVPSRFRYDKQATGGAPALPRVNLPGFGGKLSPRKFTGENFNFGGSPGIAPARSMEMGAGPLESFHGTSGSWENRLAPRNIFDVNAPGPKANLYGRGLYTTKDPGLARSYITKGDGTSPTVYRIRWRDAKNPPKFIDMDGPTSPAVIQWAEKVVAALRNTPSSTTAEFEPGEALSMLEQAIREAKRGVGPFARPTNSSLYQTVNRALNNHDIDWQHETDLLDAFTRGLQEAGFDGIKHTGGQVTGGKAHEVNIFFDPEKLHVTESMPVRTTNSAANLAPSSKMMANPLDADTAKIIEDISLGRISGNTAKVTRSQIAKSAGNADRLRDANLARKSTVWNSRGGFSITAGEKAIDAVRNGMLARNAPRVENLLDDAGVAGVKREADKFLANNLGGKRGKVTFTPAQQTTLYNRLVNAVSKAGKNGLRGAGGKKLTKEETQNLALSALRVAEDHLIFVGKHPQYWTGQQVRLSDILAETKGLDPNLVVNSFSRKSFDAVDSPMVKEAITRAIGRRSLTTGEGLASISRYVESGKKAIQSQYGDSLRYKPELDKIVNTARQIAKNSDYTATEKEALYTFLSKFVNVDKIEPEVLLAKPDIRVALLKAVATGKTNTKVINEEFEAIARLFGEKTFKEIGDPVSANRVVQTLMTRLTTWWGRKDVYRYEQSMLGYGEATAKKNGELMRNIQKNYSDDEIREAWQIATGRLDKISDGRAAGLAGTLQKNFEHMLGSSGLKEAIASGRADTPVAVKAQMAMEDINKQLKRLGEDFRFTNSAKAALPEGGTRNFSEADDWLRSWEASSPKDPASFMYNMNLAMERTTKHYLFMDELGVRFGSRTRNATVGGMKATTELSWEPRLKGVFFPEEIAQQIVRTNKMFEDPIWRTPQGLRWYSKALRIWKIGVTIYSPSHHIRNLIGDSWLMWLGGINDPRVFIKSQRILHTQRKFYEGALKAVKPGDEQSLEAAHSAIRNLSDKQDLSHAMEWASTKRSDVITKIKGKRITADQYYIQAHQHNLLLSANEAEDIYGESALGMLERSKSLNVVHSGVTKVAELREHYVRMAHFVGETEKQLKKGRSLQDAFDLSAQAVRKWHPDGRDLTSWEQNVRLAIPFYSWLRKSTPLVIQSLAQRPARVMAYPKGMTALQQLTGVEGTIDDPFPDDQLFPDWVRAYGIGPIGDASASGISGAIGNLGKTEPQPLTGDPTGYTVVNPSNPMIDFFQQFGGTGQPSDLAQGIFESSTPAFQYPAELAFGEEITDKPIGDDPAGYLGERIPFLGPASRIFNVGEASEEEGHFDKEAFLNWLTAAGIRGTGPYTDSAEFDARDRLARFEKRKLFQNGY